MFLSVLGCFEGRGRSVSGVEGHFSENRSFFVFLGVLGYGEIE